MSYQPLVMFVVAVGGLTAIAAAWHLQLVSVVLDFEPTQQRRYDILTCVTLICTPLVVLIINIDGWSQFVAQVNTGAVLTEPVKWIVVVCAWCAVFMPVIAIIAAVHIYRYPCAFAYKTPRGWRLTADVRAGCVSPMVYTDPYVRYNRHQRVS